MRRGDFTRRAKLTVDSPTGAITQTESDGLPPKGKEGRAIEVAASGIQPKPLERTARFQDWVESNEDQIRERVPLQGTADNWPEG